MTINTNIQSNTSFTPDSIKLVEPHPSTNPHTVDSFYSSVDEIEKAYQEVVTTEEPLPKHVEHRNISLQAIDKMRFSQMYIDPNTRDRKSIEELAQNIFTHGWDTNHPLHIIGMPDMEFTSLDNRRLAALKLIREKHPTRDIPNVNVIVDFFEDKSDPMTLGAVFTRLEGHNFTKEAILLESKNLRMGENTYGHCVLARMYGNSEIESQHYRKHRQQTSQFGFDATPIVRDGNLKRQFQMQHHLRS
ncbi:hypothetical protein [Simkania sp.]|uniref:hypothetical protein n=1 Tax=Simkania sp. TaxID=34094 RepID=UPI003B5179E4